MEQFHHGPAGAFEQKFMVLNNALFHKYLSGRKWEDVTVRGRMADVDLDLDDTLDLIFDSLKFALMGRFEARKGPLLFTFDVNYTNLEETNTTGRGVTVIVDRVMMRCQAAISQHHSGSGFSSL